MRTWAEHFFSANFMPHGSCYFWQPGILWINVISDLMIALAYFSIPVALVMVVRKRADFRFKGLFILFAAFITLCGLTHLFSIYTVWYGAYGFHGVLKAMTAVVSMFTAFVLFKLFPDLLKLPTPSQLEEAVQAAAEERLKLSRVELKRRAESIFKFSIELLPRGLLVIDGDLNIRIANKELEKLFGYGSEELVGAPLSQLLLPDHVGHHDVLVKNFIKNPMQGHLMAAGRVVRGRRKDGEEVFIEISLSVHESEGEKFAFAMVTNVGGFSAEQEQFLESSNRVKRAVEAIDDGIWEWNIQTNDVWYNPTLQKLIGFNDKTRNPTYEDWQAHILPEDKDSVLEQLQSHFKTKQAFDILYRGKSINGEYEWMRTRGDTIFDDQDKPLLMSGTLSNVNTFKVLEEQLREKTRFLNAVLDKSLCGTYIFDIAKNINTFINMQYTEITGYTLEDIRQLANEGKFMSIFHPDDVGGVIEHIENVKQNSDKLGVPLEYRLKHKQGHWIWCYSRDAIYTFNEDGSPKEMLGTFFDITALKEREESLQALSLDFIATFEQAAVGISHVAMGGTWLKANKKLCDILGYTWDDLSELSVQDVTFPEDFAQDEQELNRLVKGEIDQYVIEKRLIKRSGEIVWTLVTGSLVKDDQGNAEYFILVVEDISERKAMERLLASSNASLERFAYSASHDMQEPLRKIIAFTDSIEQRLVGKLDDPDARYELNRITDATSRMRTMIDSLLMLSRITKERIKKQQTTFKEMMIVILDDLSELLEESDPMISVNGDAELFVDLSGFQQIMRNLIVNAIRYAKPDERATIEIQCEEAGRDVVISVTDHGRGFDPKFVEQVFEPFRRLVGREISGSGMGLALCRQIAVTHGGSIRADSELGRYSCFTVTIPSQEK